MRFRVKDLGRKVQGKECRVLVLGFYLRVGRVELHLELCGGRFRRQLRTLSVGVCFPRVLHLKCRRLQLGFGRLQLSLVGERECKMQRGDRYTTGYEPLDRHTL